MNITPLYHYSYSYITERSFSYYNDEMTTTTTTTATTIITTTTTTGKIVVFLCIIFLFLECVWDVTSFFVQAWTVVRPIEQQQRQQQRRRRQRRHTQRLAAATTTTTTIKNNNTNNNVKRIASTLPSQQQGRGNEGRGLWNIQKDPKKGNPKMTMRMDSTANIDMKQYNNNDDDSNNNYINNRNNQEWIAMQDFLVRHPHILAPTRCSLTMTETNNSIHSKSRNRQMQQEQEQQQEYTCLSNVTLRSFLEHYDKNATLHSQQDGNRRGKGFSLAMAPKFFGFFGYLGALTAWEEQLTSTTSNSSSSSSNDDKMDIHDDDDDNDNTTAIVKATGTTMPTTSLDPKPNHYNQRRLSLLSSRLHCVVGSSAGAMVAILLAGGIHPRSAAEFCTNLTISQFADFPGWGCWGWGGWGLFRGDKFEQLIQNALIMLQPLPPPPKVERRDVRRDPADDDNDNDDDNDDKELRLEEAPSCPVAVTAYCIETRQTKLLTRGKMARAARASATFPVMFQPVHWWDEQDQRYYTLIDGGITDKDGTAALQAFVNHEDSQEKLKRVVHFKIGPFEKSFPNKNKNNIPPPGPLDISERYCHEVLSISLQNLPCCGPWDMSLNAIAVQAAHDAMVASFDLPLFVTTTTTIVDDDNKKKKKDENSCNGQRLTTPSIARYHHYELHIDASRFW